MLRLAIVTGANKGLGYHVARQLAESGRYRVLVGSRSAERGREALARMELPNTELLEIDVSSDASVAAAARDVRARHGRVDLLVNNAGILLEDDARTTVDINFHGVRRVTASFRPLLSENARVVNLSSSLGAIALGKCSEAVRARFMAERLSEDELAALLEEYCGGSASGFAASAYGVSKAGCSMLTRVHARDGLNAVALCPGWCQTDMTAGAGAPLAPEEGAARIVHAAEHGVRGKFYQNREESAWWC